MPTGKSYNNPQLEYKKNQQWLEAERNRLKTERTNTITQKQNQKKAASLQDQIQSNNDKITLLQGITIKNAEKLKAQYESELNALVRAARDPGSPGGSALDPSEEPAINAKQAQLNEQIAIITKAKQRVQELTNSNNALKKQFSQLYNVGAERGFLAEKGRKSISSSSNSSSASSSSNSKNRKNESEQIKPVGPYQYNLPLIKPARFSTSPSSPLVASMGDNANLISTPGFNTTNAENFWREKPGRGVLRVNREWMKSILNSTTTEKGNAGKLDLPGSTQRTPDRRLYGFRFLYNPEKISMVYDINADLHPGLIATGKDVFLPLTKSSSALTMSLVLNRMEDMKYRENPRLAIRNQVYYGGGETEGLLEDIRELHEKGTMYDLEYMFKVMNAPHAVFNSQLNGKTADMGFIRPAILELHLGNRLRYPVRVVSLAVEHKIFDPRMVPVFSVVQITFGRFIEFQTESPNSGAGGGGGGLLAR